MRVLYLGNIYFLILHLEAYILKKYLFSERIQNHFLEMQIRHNMVKGCFKGLFEAIVDMSQDIRHVVLHEDSKQNKA